MDLQSPLLGNTGAVVDVGAATMVMEEGEAEEGGGVMAGDLRTWGQSPSRCPELRHRKAADGSLHCAARCPLER